MEKIIKEALDNNEDNLDFSNLNLSEKNKIFIPVHPSGNWNVISFNKNKFEIIPENIPPVDYLLFSNNNIKIISKKLLNRLGKDIKTIDIQGNPVSKLFFGYRTVNNKNILKEKNVYYIIIPKGTLVFRSLRKLDDLKKMYLGYNPKNKFDEYILHPDHQTYFYICPHFINYDLYGNINTIFVLQNDVKVFLALEPSKIDKHTMLKKYFENCNKEDFSIDINDNPQAKYYCLKKEYKEKNIAGWLSTDFNLLQLNQYYKDSYYSFNNKDSRGYSIGELCLYPKIKRNKKEILTNSKDFSEEWLNKHIKEFNYKPFIIFNKTPREEIKLIFDKLLSKEGYITEDGIFHVTINKIDGTYILYEEASKETLHECISIDENRTEYLKFSNIRF